ncbi:hypothetical protein EJ04DRAFT_508936 [Polyplosphaeria fusca]|uniref:Uncharacterized protein n=1 Tax=Polyplosphaeria fusca TaxID=682080 RepID=A0A9P4RA45_9PLEO|nr:hypothetical protein EJ04DRAFT_508936 [Polyplosphaeria fusca]
MSALSPTGPSQPTQDQAYTTPGNPSSKTPSEKSQTAATSAQNTGSSAVDQRVPTKQADESQATASSLGRGIHGAPAGEERKGLGEDDVGRHTELDGEQIAAPGEGKVWEAVEGKGGKSGASGSQPDLAADLDRKKAEQAEAREAIKAQREQGVSDGGALGQQGGPANPVD